MAQGFIPAKGEFQFEEFIPASAFSKGDIVQLDSASSVSGINTLTYPDILGVAMQDSTDSIRDRCVVCLPTPTSVFLSVSTPGADLPVGAEVDVDVDANGRPVVVASTNTPRVVIWRGHDAEAEMAGFSVQSRALVRFMYNADELEMS